jgi:hypothetical protein
LVCTACTAFSHPTLVIGLYELHERRKPLSGRTILNTTLDELTLAHRRNRDQLCRWRLPASLSACHGLHRSATG